VRDPAEVIPFLEPLTAHNRAPYKQMQEGNKI